MQKPDVYWLRRAFVLSYWTEASLEKESLLHGAMDFLIPRKFFIVPDHGWSEWDLTIYRGIWSKALLKICTENHGTNKRLLRTCCNLRMSRIAVIGLCGYILLAVLGAALGMFDVAAVATVAFVIHASVILYQNYCLGRIIYHALDIVAEKLHLMPVQAAETKSDA
jgi:hypothetical protein